MSERLRRARLLRAALRLPGPVEPRTEDWSEWLELARNERVLPQLHDVATAPDTALDDEIVAAARAIHLDVAGAMVRLEHALLGIGAVLDGAGVPFAVLKGAATAHVDHPDPTCRMFGDLDLLVAPSRFADARCALQGAGWRQAYPLPRHHERFTHAVTFVGSGRAELDLHQRIAHRALGLLVPTDALLEQRVTFEVAGRRLWALDRPDRLVHAAVHAVSSRGGYRRLSSLLDVLVLSGTMTGEVGAVLERAERWRVLSLVETAIRAAHHEAMVPVPETWATAMARQPRRRDRVVDRAYLGDRRRPATEELAHLRHLGSWRDRALYVGGHLRMDEGANAGGPRRRLRYLATRLRDRTR